MQRTISVIVIVLLISLAAHAQYRSPRPTLNGILQPPGESSLYQMNMYHQVFMGVASGSFGQGSQLTYLNTMDFQFRYPLRLQIHLGMQRQNIPGYAYATGPQLIGGAELEWRPTQNTYFRLAFQHGLPARQVWGMNRTPYGYGFGTRE